MGLGGTRDAPNAAEAVANLARLRRGSLSTLGAAPRSPTQLAHLSASALTFATGAGETHPIGIQGDQAMRAALCRAFSEPLVVEDVILDPPGPGELRVKVVACAVCHSDVIYA